MQNLVSESLQSSQVESHMTQSLLFASSTYPEGQSHVLVAGLNILVPVQLVQRVVLASSHFAQELSHLMHLVLLASGINPMPHSHFPVMGSNYILL